MKKVGIIGLGKYLPDQIVTNFDLEQRLDTTDEWIRSRTGIKERRMAPDFVTTTDMAYEASLKALENANINPEDIDLILVACITLESRFPSLACRLQERLGALNATAMDIGAACAGFIYGMVTATQFIQSNSYRHVLVIGVEKLSSIINWEDRSTAVLFGDGAGAAVMGPVSDGKGILSFELGADGTGGSNLSCNESGIVMKGREVFKFAVRQMGDSCVRVLGKANIPKEEVTLLVPHQANIRIIESARERLSLPKEKVVSDIVAKYGNNSSASVPISLAERNENGLLKDGDIIVLVAFGAGLTWGSICLRWGV